MAKAKPPRRPTPPTQYAHKLIGGSGVVLNDDTRDALLQKLIVRVERMDAELEVVVDAVVGQSKTEKGIQHDISKLCSDVSSLKTQLSMIKNLLMELLGRIPTQPPSESR